MLELTSGQQQRIEELLAEMTLEEKIAQLTGIGVGALLEDGELSRAKLEQYLSEGIGQMALSAGATELPPEYFVSFPIPTRSTSRSGSYWFNTAGNSRSCKC